MVALVSILLAFVVFSTGVGLMVYYEVHPLITIVGAPVLAALCGENMGPKDPYADDDLFPQEQTRRSRDFY